MDATEQVNAAGEFFERSEGRQSIQKALSKGKDHVIVDFFDLASYSIELAEDLLEQPENVLQAMSHALEQNPSGLPHNCVVRIKNVSKTSIKKIHKLRKDDEGLFLTVEGVVKQKSGVKGQVVVIRYECGMCGNPLPILQKDEHVVQKPTICPKCAAKSRFKIIHEEKVDVFSMMIEEAPSVDASSNKLETVKILARSGLANSSVERKLYQGVKVKISGILKTKKLIVNGKTSNLVDWYIEANYIEMLEDSFNDIAYTSKDVKNFKKLSKRDNLLELFSEHIFADIYGYPEEKEGIILQLFSGNNMSTRFSNIRQNSHILLVGDAGTAKSSMLKAIQKFSPKARYVAGTGVSAVGLTGAAVKDELLGGWTVEAGAIPLSSGGVLCIDELDKVNDENKKALHEPLEDQTVSIDKGAVHATLPAHTSVLAAANPKYGKYSVQDTFYSQIELPQPLFSRFDLIYIIRSDVLSKEHHKEVLKKILYRGSKKHEQEEKNLEFEREFLLKYISYAKTINPEMSDEAFEFINDKWMKLIDFQEKNNDRTDIVSINPRYADAIKRLAMNLARLHLSEEVTLEFAEKAYEKVFYSVRMLGVEPGSGNELDDFSIKGQPKKIVSKVDIMARIIRVLREYAIENKKGMGFSELCAVLDAEGISDKDKIETYVDKLKHNGDIYEPKPDTWGVVLRR